MKKISGEGLETLADWHRFIASSLHAEALWFGHGAIDGWQEAMLFLSELTKIHPEILPDYFSTRLTLHEREKLEQWLESRILARVPAAYLVQATWFAGHHFYVDERVLVPRSPIGELIKNKFSPWLAQTPERILDMCTGSACIAIACAYEFPESQIEASDLSWDALEVAHINVDKHDLEDRLSLIQSDLFEAIPSFEYDLIVTNPPYVDAEDMSDLPEEYHHEPELGLAAGVDGLDLVRRILKEAPHYLAENGLLVCEVGNSWVAMDELWPEVPFEWVTFEQGGEGVFVIRRADLIKFKDVF